VNELAKKQGWKAFIPDFQYCTDNAAMIGITGYYKYLAGQLGSIGDKPFAR